MSEIAAHSYTNNSSLYNYRDSYLNGASSTQATGSISSNALSGQSLQDIINNAVVEALMQVISKLVQNNSMPKYTLKDVAEMLQQLLQGAGSAGGGSQGVSGDSGNAGSSVGNTGGTSATQPVATQPQPVMSAQDFADRFTVKTLMDDGSWALTTNSLAREAFGIPVGTPLNQIDLTKLNPLPGAEGTVTAPVTRVAAPAAGSASTSPEINNTMQEAGALLSKVNSGSATHEDVKAFLSKIQELAQKFGEAVGDEAAAQTGARKAKKAAAVVGGASKTIGTASSATTGVGADTKGVLSAAMSPTGSATAAASTGFDTTNGVAGGFSGSTTGKSWLMAIAEAMGNVLGSKVQQMLSASGRMASLTNDQKGLGSWQEAVTKPLDDYVAAHKADGSFNMEDYQKLQAQVKPAQDKIDTAMKANGQEFTVESSKLQGASQEFSMLQNAFSNAIKSIGEGLGQLARKG